MLAAEVGQHITIARRKGDDCFIGSITNSKAREIPIKMGFLSDGNYTADVYADTSDVAQKPNHLTQQTRTVSKTDAVMLKLAAGGGQVIRLRKQN